MKSAKYRKNNKATRTRKLPHAVIIRAPGLLPMLYKVRELAIELDIPDRTIRDWLASGAPHERDRRDHIWINGRSFAQWVSAHRQTESSKCMNDGKAYCFKCNSINHIVNPRISHIQGKLNILKGTCKQCGHPINRGIKHDR